MASVATPSIAVTRVQSEVPAPTPNSNGSSLHEPWISIIVSPGAPLSYCSWRCDITDPPVANCAHAQNGDLRSGEMVSVQFEIELSEGDVYYSINPLEPPSRLVPPYRHVSAQGGVQKLTTSFCDLATYPLVDRYAYVS